MNRYSQIIDHIRREDVIFFIGSGCSLASGAPSVSSLSEAFWQNLPKEIQSETNKEDLQSTAEALSLVENGRNTINSILVDKFGNLEPNSFHKKLIRIPHIHTFITTNYDSLIESGCIKDTFQVFCKDSDCSYFDGHKNHIYKIHGDLSSLDKIVISRTDYRHFIADPQDPLLWSLIQNEIVTRHVVFIGYSVDDDNVLNLVEDVVNKLGKQNKSMYLVCPSLKQTQVLRLKNLGITHVIGTGDELLDSTIKALKDSFGDDKRNNVCSLDTLGKFGLLNGIQMSLLNDGMHTSITKMKPTTGSLTHNLHFNTKDSSFFQYYHQTSTEIIKGFNVPYRALTAEELETFEHRVNGIKVNGKLEYTKVLFGPAIVEEDAVFSSAKGGIRIKKRIKRWSANREVHICIDNELSLVEYIIIVPEDMTKPMSGTMNIKMKDSFSNLDEAIKWSELLIALVDQDDFHIKLPQAELPMMPIDRPDISRVYHEIYEYLQNVREIEIAGNFFFDKYEPYSQDGLLISRIVKSFIKKEPFIAAPRENLKHISIDIKKGAFDNKPGLYVVRIVTNINGPIIFNSKEFNIQEERVFLKKCSICAIDTTQKDKDTLVVDNMESVVQYEYANANEPDRIIDGNVE